MDIPVQRVSNVPCKVRRLVSVSRVCRLVSKACRLVYITHQNLIFKQTGSRIHKWTYGLSRCCVVTKQRWWHYTEGGWFGFSRSSWFRSIDGVQYGHGTGINFSYLLICRILNLKILKIQVLLSSFSFAGSTLLYYRLRINYVKFVQSLLMIVGKLYLLVDKL